MVRGSQQFTVLFLEWAQVGLRPEQVTKTTRVKREGSTQQTV